MERKSYGEVDVYELKDNDNYDIKKNIVYIITFRMIMKRE